MGLFLFLSLFFFFIFRLINLISFYLSFAFFPKFFKLVYHIRYCFQKIVRPKPKITKLMCLCLKLVILISSNEISAKDIWLKWGLVIQWLTKSISIHELYHELLFILQELGITKTAPETRAVFVIVMNAVCSCSIAHTAPESRLPRVTVGGWISQDYQLLSYLFHYNVFKEGVH